MEEINIINELSQNFIEFSYETNMMRSFPDARDGLKPSQRAILWEMYRSGYSNNKPHVKCAKIVGSVIGLWSSHGDQATYDTLVRMSQPFVTLYPCISFHGGNGNQSLGQAASSSRYTEAKLSKIAEDGLLKGLDKKNVPFILNFSEDMEMPEVLPAIFPRLLVNGSQGIGMAISNLWVPHNLSEVTQIIKNYALNNILDYSCLFPSFPTNGIIINKDEISNIYKTGKGKIILRAKTEIKNDKIIITELPYQVYIEPIKEKIIELVNKGKLQGIFNIINKTSKDGLLIEIEIEKGFNPENVLEDLFSMTDLQKSFNVNQMALVEKTPKLLSLKDYIDIYLQHNMECLRRENLFDLNKAKDRKEIVEGLVKALEDIDNIISLIKKSESSSKAKEELISKYKFTERQAQSILDMKLSKLARLEAVELNKELQGLIEIINSINTFLSSEEAQKEKVISNLEEFTKKYGTERKTQLIQLEPQKKKEKVIVEAQICIGLTNKDELVRRPNNKKISSLKEVICANTTEYFYLFSSFGNVYRFLGNEVSSNPVSVYDCLPLVDGEEIIGISTINETQSVVSITRDGRIKKTKAQEYLDLKKKKAISIKLKEEDRVVAVLVTNDGQSISIETNKGKIETSESAHLSKGRATIGTKLSSHKDLIVKSAI